MDRPELLERSDELGVLHGLVADMAATGGGGVVIASGEAGIGKTALLRPYDAAIALLPSSDGSLLRAAHEQLRVLGAKPAAAILARRLRELGERNLPRAPGQRPARTPPG